MKTFKKTQKRTVNKKNRKNVFTYMVKNIGKLERELMPNVIATLPNIGGALCSTPRSLDDTHYYSAVQ